MFARLFLCALVANSVIYCCNSSRAAVITYTDFNDLSDFTLNGVTGSINTGGMGVVSTYDGPGRVLRLTNNLWQSGSAFLTDAISLADEASFSTAFQFRFSDQQNAGADGIVFVVQTNANTAGGAGGGIGYQGIPNSVGIEFDNWNNGSSDGSSESHVGINLNGSVSSVARANTPLSLDNPSQLWHAWVDYNGTTNLLEVRLNTSDSRPSVAIVSYTVDLVDVLGQENAFVGFTSGTGAAGADHDIVKWQFENTFNPIDDIAAVPEPSAYSVVTGLILCFGAAGGWRYRRKARS